MAPSATLRFYDACRLEPVEEDNVLGSPVRIFVYSVGDEEAIAHNRTQPLCPDNVDLHDEIYLLSDSMQATKHTAAMEADETGNDTAVWNQRPAPGAQKDEDSDDASEGVPQRDEHSKGVSQRDEDSDDASEGVPQRDEHSEGVSQRDEDRDDASEGVSQRDEDSDDASSEGVPQRHEHSEGVSQRDEQSDDASEGVSPATRSRANVAVSLAPAAKRRRTLGGSGAMVGQEEFDYEQVKRSYVADSPHVKDKQFDPRRTTLRQYQLPAKILYTDSTSCAMDAFNMGVGWQALTRAGLEKHGAEVTLAETTICTSVDGTSKPKEPMPVNYSHERVNADMKRAGYVLDCVGGKEFPPTMQHVLTQRNGVYLVEFGWCNGGGQVTFHVVAVNCDLRLVFCNTLGALPFSLAQEHGKWNRRESVETHRNVARRFHIRTVVRVWRILCARPSGSK